MCSYCQKESVNVGSSVELETDSEPLLFKVDSSAWWEKIQRKGGWAWSLQTSNVVYPGLCVWLLSKPFNLFLPFAEQKGVLWIFFFGVQTYKKIFWVSAISFVIERRNMYIKTWLMPSKNVLFELQLETAFSPLILSLQSKARLLPGLLWLCGLLQWLRLLLWECLQDLPGFLWGRARLLRSCSFFLHTLATFKCDKTFQAPSLICIKE